MFYMIVANGDPWIDNDGHDMWAGIEARTLADMLERMGYDVEVIPV